MRPLDPVILEVVVAVAWFMHASYLRVYLG
jgi:hypothetical protein